MLIDLKKEEGPSGLGGQGSFLSWLLWDGMSRGGKGVDFFHKAGVTHQTWQDTKQNLEVKLTINGIEVPVVQTFEFLKTQFDSEVARHAVHLLAKELQGMDDVKEKMDELDRLLIQKLMKLDPTWDPNN